MRTEAEIRDAMKQVEARLDKMEDAGEYGHPKYEEAIVELNTLEEELDSIEMYGEGF